MSETSNAMDQTMPPSTMQWIVSLAISVVCCAILFVVFAGYIIEIHNMTAITTVRMEVMQERINNISSEMDTVRVSKAQSKAVAAPADEQK